MKRVHKAWKNNDDKKVRNK